ncbi:hypothetical protein Cantr_03132 [Candida viswanathii]|uniref:25S rRNA adenine-N(1) methyltransferase n=1 Tax=Candida viswanathii TaxID=5486 RepID=A0A367YMW4_9ASCO|nr:hypothetical protein Cantr_03132 [Candida viswanathii]
MAKKKTRSGLLKAPKTITGKLGTPKSLKPQRTREIIRRFHVLQKSKNSVISKLRKSYPQITANDYTQLQQDSTYKAAFTSFVAPAKYSDNQIYKIDDTLSRTDLIEILAKIDAEVQQRGGIEAYQSASTQGQTSKRGGDSSKKLVEWLHLDEYRGRLENVTALEIGCLSPHNVISTCGIFKEIVRIDLNSQDPLILEQNFMDRPLPKDESEKFNLISCSLVINFVPSPKERGEMLVRMTQFLKKPKKSMSSLFLVLPLPCVSNSRYFDNERLLDMMNQLGFRQTFYYEAKKVAYWLFDWTGKVKLTTKFPKKELHSGSSKNNFCITIS